MKAFQPLILLFVVLTLLVPMGFAGESVRAADVLTHLEETPVSQRDGDVTRSPDRIIVKFHAGTMPRSTIQGSPATGRASLDAILSAHNLQATNRLFRATLAVEPMELSQIYVLRFQPGTDLDSLLTLLETDPNVEWAEPDYLAFAAATTPNDPHFAGQWGLTKIEAPAAWDVTTGSATIPIAIVDSGIQFSHPDLSGKLWVNPGETAGNGLDDDNNGYVDDVNGWDFVNADNAPGDDNGHGTQVAGIAAASSNNGTGITGVCWGCKIMPVKVMQAGGVANYSDIAAGVLYAAQKGAKVINLSLGGYSDSAALRSAVQAAAETYGAVVVAGAGNDDLSTPFYPAAYDQVLAVGGTDQTDAKTALSNYGTWLDVSAPAEGIKTTFMGGDYGDVDGTSYAAPFAAGIAGLLRSQNPSWSAGTARAQIIHTADDIDSLNPGFQGKLGSGRVNADGAVSTTARPLLSIQTYAVDGVTSGRPEPGSTVDLDVTLYNDWADANSVQATLSSSDPNVTIVSGAASFGNIPAYGMGVDATPLRFTVDGSAPYGHDMALSLHITAGGGYSANVPLTIQTASSTVVAPATITTQTWTNDRIYLINKETGIPSGETLTIEPGTEIRFDGEYSLSVLGELVADGTSSQPIRFTSNQPSPQMGDWGWIKFLISSTDATFDTEGNYTGGSILRNALIEYGQGVMLGYAAPYIAHNTFEQVGGDDDGAAMGGIDGAAGSGLVIEDNTLLGTYIQIMESTGPFSIIGNTIFSAPFGMHVGGNDGAPAIIKENAIYNTSDRGIYASGALTVTHNSVVGCATGMYLAGAESVNMNLIANCTGYGLHILGGTPLVVSNTVISNEGAGVYVQESIPTIRHNNLLRAGSAHALHNAGSNAIDATFNWWGATSESAIEEAIYDDLDEFGIGPVDHGSYLSAPEPSAPAYVTDVHISPDTTLGIQTATFDVQFSRVMSQTIEPVLSFQAAKHGAWSVYNVDNSGLPHNSVNVIATDPDGSHWFGTGDWFGTSGSGGAANFDGVNWTVYNTDNSGLPTNDVRAIATDPDGSHWFGTVGGGVAHFDGTTWTVYNTANSGLPGDYVSTIATDPDGAHWFGTVGGGVVHFEGNTWTVYNSDNSGLPSNDVQAVATDPDGSHWFGTINGGGVAHFDGVIWTVYNTSNSGLAEDAVYAIATDLDGSHCFGTGSGVTHFDGTTWTTYNPANSGLPENSVYAIVADPDGSHWFGTRLGGAAHFDGTIWTTYNPDNSELPGFDVFTIATDPDGSHWFGTAGSGAAVLWNSPAYPVVENAQWSNENTYRATYDITSLIPRGDYLVSVGGVAGTDGIESVPVVGYTFTVDYAGAIGDTTPPPAPTVLACGASNPHTLSAKWVVSDPESEITLHQYAIGSTPGGSDVINWTNATQTSFNRTGLNLTSGQTYYVAVRSRNEGGLWSEVGVSTGVVAGAGGCPGAAFTVDAVSGPVPLSVQFSDQSAGNVTGWLWDFGDDANSTAQNPGHIYTEQGLYTVSLFVSGPGGSDLLEKKSYITALPDRSVYLPIISK